MIIRRGHEREKEKGSEIKWKELRMEELES